MHINQHNPNTLYSGDTIQREWAGARDIKVLCDGLDAASLHAGSFAHPLVRRVPVKDFLRLAGNAPIVDVRSPAEFARAHIPNAVNIPLFDNDERAKVGTAYTQLGPREGIRIGLAYARAKAEQLVHAFAAVRAPYAKDAPLGIYCLRGGMRSASLAWLLSTVAVVECRLLERGYKAFRRCVLDCFAYPRPMRILGGKTGAGKTHVLTLLAQRGFSVVDLEKLAEHRGSAFGQTAFPQPTTEHFENRLAVALLRLPQDEPVWIEDESENIGSVNIPRSFHKQMQAASPLLLETPDEARLERVLEEYGTLPRNNMAEALDRIRKRLGGAAHKEARALLETGDLRGLARILLEYYDRSYAKQLSSRTPLGVVQAVDPAEAAAILVRDYTNKPCLAPCVSATA